MTERIFPAKLEWPVAVENLDAVPRNTSRIRLISKATRFETLAEFKDLTALWCFGIEQKKLDHISSCRSLERLYIDYNLRAGDFSPLKLLPKLDVCSQCDVGRLAKHVNEFEQIKKNAGG